MRRLQPVGLALGVGLGALVACFAAPPLVGPYLCDQGTCADPGLTCVNGLCCNPSGEPACEGGGNGDGGSDGGGGDGGGGSDGGGGTDGGTDAGSCVLPPNLDCDVEGAQGVCIPGRQSRAGGTLRCESLVGPTQETCNGLDDNCDGFADNAPRCPPPSFVNPPPDAGFVFGAEATSTQPFRDHATCVKGLTGNRVESYDGGRWTGGGAVDHIAWVELAGAGTWDLTRANLRLALWFEGPANNLNSIAPFEFYQPQVFLCGNFGTMRRLDPFNASQIVVTGSRIEVNTLVDIAPVSGSIYRIGRSSVPDIDLANVRRIEILIAPAPNGTMIPSFDLTFHAFGFLPP